ncbi:DUF3011 domain-containing protein [Candidatus Binatus sp.]|jgi:hypothetical protein|uniref:DUF3011 domain-containing protein n=1 Tax=Candidatus Binatus sp. TaxID=2811406 RepID=UPI003C89BEB4
MKIKITARRILPAITLMLALANGSALAGTVNCDSYGGARNTCGADTRNGVALAHQLSGAKCKMGVSWGVQDNNRIWVDQGCRGVFTTGVMWSNNGGGGGGGGGQRLTCASYSNRRTECPANTGGRVSLTRQWSNAPCIQGMSWGYNNRMVWVDRGCRADFQFGN